VSPIRVYTTRFCWYCRAAKRLLEDKGLPYEEIKVSGDQETRAWLKRVTGQHTVPQIFVGDRSIGGFTDLDALEKTGDFDRILADQGSVQQ